MMRFPLGRLLLASLPLLLAACGGGDGASASAQPQAPAMIGDVPTAAVADAGAYARFVAAQVGTQGQQALNLGDLTPPVSDTDAPIAVQ